MKGIKRVVIGSAVGGLLGAASFFVVDGLIPAAGDASGTWIEVYRNPRKVRPGTVGEMLKIYGDIAWVDAQSIIKRGNYAYYNLAFDFIDQLGRPHDSSKKSFGRQANCITKTFTTSKGEEPWGGGWEGAAASFACR